MKPIHCFENIIAAVSAPDKIKSARDRQIVSLSQYADPTVFILHEGLAALYRDFDHVLMANLHAPMIIGINIMITSTPSVYLQARGTMRYELMPRDNIMRIVEQKGLWEEMTHISMFLTSCLHTEMMNAHAIPTYDLIKIHLEKLMSEPDTVRLKTNASDYIREKTMLSRSNIMKTLKDLNEGGYIRLQRGKLVEIIKLPAGY